MDKPNEEDFLKNPEFLQHLDVLAKTLKIPPHPDPQVVLNTAFQIIRRKFQETPSQIDTKKAQAVLNDPNSYPLGFDTGGIRFCLFLNFS